MEIIYQLEEREKKLLEELEKIKTVKGYIKDLFALKETNIIEVEENTLRFDIFERINITPPNAPLNKVMFNKLTPKLYCSKGENCYLVSGSLVFEMHYLCDLHSHAVLFSHNVPVEINIPIERIQDASNLKYKVLNHGVEVLGKRAINLTGVLEVEI